MQPEMQDWSLNAVVRSGNESWMFDFRVYGSVR